jgi:RimJ/RimL family protein N-acetyltransferase
MSGRSDVEIVLREVHDSDLPVFFRQTNDPEAARMAVFTVKDPADRDAFEAHWKQIRASSDVVNRTVLAGGDVVGSAAVYGEPGEREVTYWIEAWSTRSPASAPTRVM